MKPPFVYRLVLLIVHAVLNFIATTLIMEMDLTGSWMSVLLFSIFVLASLIFLIQHIISFILYLKNKTT